MRPPQNAGEDGATQYAAVVPDGASMRPPQNAGEDLVNVRGKGRDGTASMRPPQNAGEDPSLRRFADVRAYDASMRPPQNAGEDPCPWDFHPAPGRCFNETPAERGGRLRTWHQAWRSPMASMRPPQNAGEDLH